MEMNENSTSDKINYMTCNNVIIIIRHTREYATHIVSRIVSFHALTFWKNPVLALHLQCSVLINHFTLPLD